MTELTLLLHNIRSTYNVGSIFRTAEGFGVHRIICSGYTPYPSLPNDSRLPHIHKKLTRQINKTALGAENLVAYEYVDDLSQWLASNPLPLYALEQSENSTNLKTFNPPPKMLLLLGEEVHGIEPELLKKSQAVIEIPMAGKKESFNVSVAVGIALFHIFG